MTITNSVFTNNSTNTSGSKYGGAIYSSLALYSYNPDYKVNNITISGSEFNANNAYTNGGAIYLSLGGSDVSTVNISDTSFTENYVSITSGSGGGALYLYNGTFNLDNVTFDGNYAYYGGAIIMNSGGTYNYGTTLNIKNSTFKNNYTTQQDGGALYLVNGTNNGITVDNTLFDTNTAADDGGAIMTLGSNENNASVIEYITNSTFTNNTSGYDGGAICSSGIIKYIENTYFSNNTAARDGGAIWSALYETVPVVYNSIFNENKATSDTTKTITGGAISLDSYYTDGGAPAGTLTIVDSTFTNNYSAQVGGAIYSYANLNIYADNSDVLFSNNTAGTYGNDIYLDEGSMELAASSDYKIIFNSGIDTYNGDETVNINNGTKSYTLSDGNTYKVDSTGEIQFNNYVNGTTLNLYAGTLSIGQNDDVNSTVDNPDGFINSSSLYIQGASTLSTVNNVIGSLTPIAFEINSELQYNFDVDLSRATADTLYGASLGSEGSVILKLADLNIMNDTNEDSVKILYSENNVEASLEGSQYTTSNATYTVSALNEDSGSYLEFTGSSFSFGGLAGAIYLASDVYSITNSEDENVTEWISNTNILSNDLVVNANGYAITTDNSLSGIINDGYELTINNASSVSGFVNALTNNSSNSVININDTSFTVNTGDAIITNNGGTVNINSTDSVYFDDSADNAVLSDGGVINITGSGETVFDGNVTGSNESEMNISSDVTFNGDVSGMNIIQNSGDVSINTFSDGDYSLYGNTLNILDESGFTPGNWYLNGGTVNLANGTVGSVSAGSIYLNSDTNISVDVDLANSLMDTIYADSLGAYSGTINVNEFNILNNSSASSISILFTDSVLKDYVTTDITSVTGLIYKYTVDYDKTTGMFNFTTNTGSYNSYNPSVFAAPIAAQLGGYLTQLNSYDEAFRNMDMYMLMTKKQRQALKNANKYAAADSSLAFSPLSTPYTDKAGWIRPYTTFESVGLKNGPDVSNVAYGMYGGLESEMYDLGNGWDGIYSIYAGYNGSHQAYQGNSIYQNGGTLGIVGMAYKDNFFTGLTVNAGANAGQADTMYGKDDFSMLMAGIASKTGYNYELADGKFIIQPNFLMSYSFVNTFDYTSAAGVRIDSDPLHAIQLEPGFKFIGNLNNGWQPYAGVSVVWNIMDKTHFTANDVSLPELSVKPFVKYGVGIRKTWGKRFVGYLQTFLTNGGRNGIGFQAGFRWTLGKNPAKYTNSTGEKKYIKAKA